LFSKVRFEPPVMVWIVPKVGKLVACWEDSWFGGGGGLFGSAFGWDVCELAMGYVICRGAGG
jgi:hypothetical protein